MRRRLCLIAWLAFSLHCCIPVYAIDPNVAAGLKVGIPYEFVDVKTSGYDGPSTIESSQAKYIKPSVSGSFEVSLPWNLALEVSACYKEMKYHRSVEVQSGICRACTVSIRRYDSDSQAHAWEFPLIVRQYLMPHRRTHVFAEGGFAVRRSYRTDNTLETRTIPSTSTTTTFVPLYPKETKYIRKGFVAGLGVDIPLTALHILPEVRYTKWLSPETIHLAGDDDANTTHSLEILIGFRFGGKSAHPK